MREPSMPEYDHNYNDYNDNDELDELCLDCLEEDDLDDLADVCDLLDNDHNLTDSGYSYLAILDSKGLFV
jgi:hypothetical protein